MEDDQQITSGSSRRRPRGLEAEKRAGAIERLKALRQGGRRTSSEGPSYDVKLDEPIYQVMEEDEYEKFVSNRRKEVADFIEADDADGDLGYLDDGGEEDWTLAARVFSSDESDGDGGGNVPRRKKAEKKEKETTTNKPNKSAAALSAAAAMMGKQRLALMFTSSNFNKKSKETDKLKCESIVDDVIRQFAPDESDRVLRRRGQQSVHPAGSRQQLGGYETVNHVKCENRFVENENWNDTVDEMSLILEGEKNLGTPLENVSSIIDGDVVEEKKLGPGVEMKEAFVKDEAEEKVVLPKLNAKIGEVEKGATLSATADWMAVKSERGGDVNGITERKVSNDIGAQSDLQLDADGSLPFYIIDAYEESFGANMGTLYLFGKVIF